MPRMFKNYRWVVVGWFFIITMISYLDRVNLSMAAPLILKEFLMKPSELGIILGAFTLGYALLNFPAGFISARFSGRRVIAIILFLWSIMTLLTGLAWGFMSLLVLRVIFGMAEGPMFPACNGVLSYWMLPRERARAAGFFTSAIPLGALVGILLSAIIIEYWGWRAVFYIFGIAGILASFVSWFIITDTPAEHSLVSPEELKLIEASYAPPATSSAAGSTFGELLRDRSVWLCAVAAFFMALAYWATLSWLPTYFVMARKTTILKSGYLSSLPWIVAFLGMVSLGWASDKIGKGYRGNWLAFSMFISVPFIAYAVITPSLMVSLVCFSVSLFFNLGAIGLIVAYFHEIWDRADVPKVHGMAQAAMSLAGFVGPYLVGYILEKTNSFSLAYYIFAGCAFFSGFVLFLLYIKEKQVRIIRQKSMAPGPAGVKV